MANHYETLGIRRNADQQEIKDQYRRLSKKYHPDKQGGDEKKFKAIAGAYEILSDSERRKIYDLTGSDVTAAEFDRKAGGLLQQMFQLVVSQKGLEKIQETDVIKNMTEQLALGMSGLDKNIDVAKKSRKEIGKILKRVRHKNKMNPISVMLRHEIQKHTDTITKSNQEKKVGDIAKKMLKEYGFDFEEQIKINYRPTFGMNLGRTSDFVFTGWYNEKI